MNLRGLRRNKKISLPQLAKVTGFSKGYLSKIENSDRLPPVSTLQRIAYALDMDFMKLLDQAPRAEAARRDIDIVHAGELAEQGRAETSGGYRYASLLHRHFNHQMTPFLMLVEKGKTEVFSHDSEEFCHVLEGAFTLRYGGQSYELGKGDSFYFDSRIEHSFVNDHDATVRILAVNYNYRRF